jgi:predicted Zn-ribbon and HTH transcriptional regulator
MDQMKKYICKRCGHKWFPRTEKVPVACPACKNSYWNRERVRPAKFVVAKAAI